MSTDTRELIRAAIVGSTAGTPSDKKMVSVSFTRPELDLILSLVERDEAKGEPLDRGEAVNLAANVVLCKVENRKPGITEKGILFLADELLKMDAELRRLYDERGTSPQEGS